MLLCHKAGFNVPYIYYLYNAGGDYKSEIQNSTVKTTYLNPEVSYFSNFCREKSDSVNGLII